jgi:hypothetical protein
MQRYPPLGAAMYPSALDAVKHAQAVAGALAEAATTGGDAVDQTEAGNAARATLADAMAAAGAGPAFAREVYGDVIRASAIGYAPPTPDAAVKELRAVWGKDFDANAKAARALVAKAAKRDPAIVPFLERTGLGNDPAFIRKLATRAAALRRR